MQVGKLSVRKIKERIGRKSSARLRETLQSALKSDGWRDLSKKLAVARRKQLALNLDEINELAKDGDVVVVPGRVLSQGMITKKVKVCAFGFSKRAQEKLQEGKVEFAHVFEEIKTNPSAKNVRVLA
ncbi:50S ribosomal protein L18e [Candidatus Pacearchaeota archaeon]|nr:MAG: 50S ribosomal protein L18e [Candidatus Pacearchaeota archaeon]